MIVDGEGQVLGRLASNVARLARDGEEVKIVNCEKSAITGRREDVLERYKEKYERGDKDHGPKFPRRPDRILRRTVRGMLPHRKPTGAEALERVQTFLGVPRGLEGREMERFDDAELRSKSYVELGEVSRYLGSNF